jgi:hypothetical protein
LETDADNVDGINLEPVPFRLDIFDPRYWDPLDQMIDILVQKDCRRDLSIQKGPKDRLSRRFSATLYTRVLSNGEKCDREWLVYSKELGGVFCFCCKLLKKGHSKSQLANEGFSVWSHVHRSLKEHKICAKHIAKIWSLGMKCVSGLLKLKQLIKLLSENLRKKKITGTRFYLDIF